MKWPAQLRFRQLLRHSLVQNALTMYGVFLPNYLVPLLLIPYVARVLGATGWGLVAFGQALGVYLGAFVEFGFFLSANREVARYRDDTDKLADVVAGVLGVRLALGAAVVLVALAARAWIPIFHEHPGLLAASAFWGVVQGFSMSWFFQGLERMRLVAALEVPAQFLGIIAILVFVHRADQGWLVLVIQGMAYGLPAAIELVLAYREVPFRLPTLGLIRQTFRMAGSIFVSRTALTLYTSGNALILGLFVTPQLVGYYVAAEKIGRAAYRLLNPITQALYPRLSYLVEHSKNDARRLARKGVMLIGAGGAALALFLFVSAPWVIRIIFGPEFGPAVPLMRILSLMPALVALWEAHGTQWMLPLGLDRSFNFLVLLAGVVNVVLALVLVPRYADFGMASSAIISESVVAFGSYAVLRWYRLHPAGANAL